MVSTPIGNLGDLTFRAVEVLRTAAVILAEDTRHSRTLLAHHGISTPMAAYHEHNEARMTPRILERLHAGEDVALVSDAGTPLVSDPGARLVQAAAGAGLPVVPVPGASAVLAALVASGLPGERFTFFGFPARKGRERGELLADVAALRHTAVLYEAPGRVADTLAELAVAAGGARPAVVARELTKQFEEVRRGTLDGLAAYYADAPPRGEVVILVGGGSAEAPSEERLRDRARELAGEGRSARDVSRVLTAEFEVPRNLAYRLAQEAGRGAGHDGEDEEER